MALRRSQLSTPASDFEMMTKAAKSDADEVFLDLEDSVAPSEKPDSRDRIVRALNEGEWGGKVSSYRINSLDTKWWYEDVIDVVARAGRYVDDIIIPKVGSVSDIHTVDNLLKQVEVNNGLDTGAIGLEAQIETATGMNNIVEIANGSERLSALIFGPGDYTVSIGAKNVSLNGSDDYPGHLWHYPLQRMAHAAKAAGLQAIDGPFANIKDDSNYRESCRRAAMCGCDGKWAIHPNQIPPANKEFAPTSDEIENAEKIIVAVEDARNRGKGAATVDDQMVDEATRKNAIKVLENADEAGLR